MRENVFNNSANDNCLPFKSSAVNHKQQDILLVEYYRGENSQRKTCRIFAGFGNIFNEVNITVFVPFRFF